MNTVGGVDPHPTVAAAAVFSGGVDPPQQQHHFLGLGGVTPPPTLLQQGCPLALGGVYHRANALAARGYLGGVDPPLGCFPYITVSKSKSVLSKMLARSRLVEKKKTPGPIWGNHR